MKKKTSNQKKSASNQADDHINVQIDEAALNNVISEGRPTMTLFYRSPNRCNRIMTLSGILQFGDEPIWHRDEPSFTFGVDILLKHTLNEDGAVEFLSIDHTGDFITDTGSVLCQVYSMDINHDHTPHVTHVPLILESEDQAWINKALPILVKRLYPEFNLMNILIKKLL